MPANRAGKIIRCPGCRAVIRVGKITVSEQASGEPVSLKAEPVEITAAPEVDSGNESAGSHPDLESGPASPSARLDVLDFVPPESPGTTAAIAEPGDVNEEGISLFDKFEDRGPSPARLKQRAENSRSDRVALAKVFALLICVVAAINLAPAIYFWIQWSQGSDRVALPRWIYLQVFLAAVHLVYALFLVQVPDWSALKTVAIAMLVMAFVLGFLSTGLIMGGSRGAIARFLEVPNVMVARACIWTVAMLCLATLMSYMIGREAVNWQRAEQLLREILHGEMAEARYGA